MPTTWPHPSAQREARETLGRVNSFPKIISPSRLGHLQLGLLFLYFSWPHAGFAQLTNDLRLEVLHDGVPVAGDHVYLVTIPPEHRTAAKEVEAGGQVEFTYLRNTSYCVVDEEHRGEEVPWTAKISTENASLGYQRVDLNNNDHCEPGDPDQMTQE